MEKLSISPAEYFAAVSPAISAGEPVVFTVTGGSMLPFLGSGRDRVVIRSADFSSLRLGDIVLVKAAEDRYLLHRVIQIKNDSFVTRGDWNPSDDGEFPPEALFARVISVFRNGRTIDASSPLWRAMGKLWNALFPLRPLLKRIILSVSRINPGKA